MRQIGSTRFQAHAAEVLRLVEAGETVRITRRGRVSLILTRPGAAGFLCLWRGRDEAMFPG